MSDKNSESFVTTNGNSLYLEKCMLTVQFSEKVLNRIKNKSSNVDINLTLECHEILKVIKDDFPTINNIIKQYFGHNIGYYFNIINVYPVFSKNHKKGFQLLDDKVNENRFLSKKTAFALGFLDRKDILMAFTNLLCQEIIKSYIVRKNIIDKIDYYLGYKSDSGIYNLQFVNLLADFISEYLFGNMIYGYEENPRIKKDKALFRKLNTMFITRGKKINKLIDDFITDSIDLAYLIDSIKERDINKKKYIETIED